MGYNKGKRFDLRINSPALGIIEEWSIAMAGKKGPKIVVTQQSETGRNTQFKNTQTGEEKTRAQIVKDIESGNLPGYHVRKIDGVKTPVSNPDNSEKNNLG